MNTNISSNNTVPMTVKKSSERGGTKIDWLDSKHSFSFGDYFDKEFVQFGALRVINEDIVSADSGFGTHSHRDMEILTYILSGELEHQDSMGNGSVLTAGKIQRMTAGTGVRHSEWNHSKDKPVHFLQIWIIPQSAGLTPSYEEKDCGDASNEWQVIASNVENQGVYVHQDLSLSRARLDSKGLNLQVKPGRKAWIQVIEGDCKVGEVSLSSGDAVSLEGEADLNLSADQSACVLWFDLAA